MTNREAIEILDELKKYYLGGIVDAIDMAIKALKPQEPHVMTLEEVKASKGNDLYLELSNHPDETPYITAATLDEVGKIWVNFYHTVCNFCDYGRRVYGWRCWTSRPTDEQREAEPWN
jgi:hypothetical protein